MKKTLLLQSALVAAAGVMLADVASAQVKAEPLSITVGGYFSQFYKVQDRDKQGQVDAATQNFASDAEIHFNIRTVLDNGLRIGGRVELEAASYTDQIDERYLFLEHNDWGRMELGSTDKVSGKMLYFAPNSLPGHSTTVHSEYSAAANTPLMWFANANHDTEGVNIYTAANRYFGSKAGKGIQLGLSYTPDGCEDFAQANGTGLSIAAGSGRSCGANFGQTTIGTAGSAGTVGAQLSQQYTVAGNYIETFGGVDVALYAAYNSVHIEGALGAGVNDPRQAGWQIGAQLNIPLDAGAAVQVGGGYSREDVGVAAVEKRKAYSAGVRYLSNGANPGSWGIGAEYYTRTDDAIVAVGNIQDLKLQYYHVGLTYQLAAGVLTWAGLGVSDLDRPAGVGGGIDVNQTFGVIGIGLTF